LDKIKSFHKVILISALVLVLGGCSLQPNTINDLSNTGQVGSSLAGRLTEAGFKVYTAWWCSGCKFQKQVFGDDWDNINNIECSEPSVRSQKEICKEAGIKAYPTWEFPDGTRHEGVLSLPELEQKLVE